MTDPSGRGGPFAELARRGVYQTVGIYVAVAPGAIEPRCPERKGPCEQGPWTVDGRVRR
jgi:hypothetical protein